MADLTALFFCGPSMFQLIVRPIGLKNTVTEHRTVFYHSSYVSAAAGVIKVARAASLTYGKHSPLLIRDDEEQGVAVAGWEIDGAFVPLFVLEIDEVDMGSDSTEDEALPHAV